ncbi:hypothetical protein, partial [Thalassolituus sp. UBA1505]|uniref:hypothetical protein n=1 Tax=Thalassolituus sp. UBA1505 TaxID=1947653 RepID=UPI0025FC4F03
FFTPKGENDAGNQKISAADCSVTMRRKNSSRTATKTYKTVPATTTSKAADRSGSSAPADRPAAVQFP